MHLVNFCSQESFFCIHPLVLSFNSLFFGRFGGWSHLLFCVWHWKAFLLCSLLKNFMLWYKIICYSYFLLAAWRYYYIHFWHLLLKVTWPLSFGHCLTIKLSFLLAMFLNYFILKVKHFHYAVPMKSFIYCLLIKMNTLLDIVLLSNCGIHKTCSICFLSFNFWMNTAYFHCSYITLLNFLFPNGSLNNSAYIVYSYYFKFIPFLIDSLHSKDLKTVLKKMSEKIIYAIILNFIMLKVQLLHL